MANYYCLMAGVPDLKLSDATPGYSTAELRQQLEAEIGRHDATLLHFLFLERDCRNLALLLKDADAQTEEGGNYSRSELEELIAQANEIDLGKSRYPEFMLDFVRSHADNQQREGYYPEDEAMMLYYEYCTLHCKDSLMRRWYKMNFDMANIMTAMIARRQGWNVADYVKGDGEVPEALRTSDAPDFGLASQLPYMTEIMNIVDEEDPVKKERMADALKWNWLEVETFADTFSIEAVFAYLCRLAIQERWARLDAEQGRETFEKIIHDLRSEAEVPEEFILKTIK